MNDDIEGRMIEDDARKLRNHTPEGGYPPAPARRPGSRGRKRAKVTHVTANEWLVEEMGGRRHGPFVAIDGDK